MKKITLLILTAVCFWGCQVSVNQEPSFNLFEPNIFTSPKNIYDFNVPREPEDVDLFIIKKNDTLHRFQITINEEPIMCEQSWEFSLKKEDCDSFLLQHKALAGKNFIICNNQLFMFSKWERNDSLDVEIRFLFPHLGFRDKLPLKHAYCESSYYPLPTKKEIFFNKLKVELKNLGVWYKSIWFKCFCNIDQTPNLAVAKPNIFTSVKGLKLPNNYTENRYQVQNGDTLITFNFTNNPTHQVISQQWTFSVNDKEYSDWTRYNDYYLDENKMTETPILYRNRNEVYLFTSKRIKENEVSVTLEYLFPNRKELEKRVPYL